MLEFFFFSSRRRHTRCALVTGVQTCALPIYGDAPPREVHGLVRPCAGVERSAAEAVDAGNFGQLGGGQAAGRHHAVLRRYPLAAVGAHVPAAGALVEGGAGDARVEGYVAALVVTVVYIACLAEVFGLARSTLGP